MIKYAALLFITVFLIIPPTAAVSMHEEIPEPSLAVSSLEADGNKREIEIKNEQILIVPDNENKNTPLLKIDISSMEDELKDNLRQEEPYYLNLVCTGKESPSHILSVAKKVISEKGNDNLIRGIILDLPFSREEKIFKEQTTLYQAAASLFKKHFPRILIGGCGFACIFDNEENGDFKDISPDVSYFMEKCSQSKTPIDFLTIKSRGLIPYGYYARNLYLKEKIFPIYKIRTEVMDILSEDKTNETFFEILRFQSFICSIKSDSGRTVATPVSTFAPLYNLFISHPIMLQLKGTDKLSLIGAVLQNKDRSSAAVIITSANPSQKLLQNNGERDVKLKKEYKNYIHSFNDGLYPYLYTRYRLNLSNFMMRDRRIRITRYIYTDKGVETAEVKELEGLNDYYFNKELQSPSVTCIILESIPEQEPEKK